MIDKLLKDIIEQAFYAGVECQDESPTIEVSIDVANLKTQLLAEILKGKEIFNVPEYEQGIIEAIPTQYINNLFGETE